MIGKIYIFDYILYYCKIREEMKKMIGEQYAYIRHNNDNNEETVQKLEYIKYSKAIIKIKENNRTTKLSCNIPLHCDDIRDLNTAFMIANSIIYLYSTLLNVNNLSIIEISIKLSNNRIAIYSVRNNKILNLKNIVFKNDISLSQNIEGIG